MGNVAFRKIQIGEESTEGTAVPATAILVPGEHGRGLTVENRASLVRRAIPGILSQFGRQVLAQQQVGLSLDADLTPEQVLYILHAGLKGNVTPSGTAAPYTWTFARGTSAVQALDSFTVEYGDEVQAYEVNGCVVESFELGGALGGGDLCYMRATLVGWTRTTTTFTPALSVPAVVPLAGNFSALYIDDSWANLGTNQLDAELLGWSLAVPCVEVKYRKPTLYPSGHRVKLEVAKLMLRLEHTSNAVSELSKVEPGTARFVRILVQKDANHSVQIDACVTWDPTSILEADGSDNTVTLNGVSAYDGTGTEELEIVVVNEVDALP